MLVDTSGTQTFAIVLSLALSFEDIDSFMIATRQLSFKDSKFANLINDLKETLLLILQIGLALWKEGYVF